MELILALLAAGPTGYFALSRARGLTVYLVLWAIVFPIQTLVVVVLAGDHEVFYWVVNVVILGVGIGLSSVGSILGEQLRACAPTSVRAA
jgi:hypothetical protein